MARPYPETLPNPYLLPMTAKDVNRVDGLKSVCLFLGPYRNLTTLTGSVLALHPECQVLDHASQRVFGNDRINFLDRFNEEKFRQFCHFAITMSQGGTRGRYGGTMLVSHAFADNLPLRRVYLKRYGTRLLKLQIKSVVWKEPQRVTQIVRQKNYPFAELLEANPLLRFLLPVRNPMDTAKSITRMGGNRWYGDVIKGDIRKALTLVLDDIRWFLKWEQRAPGRFFHFYQDELDIDMLTRLAEFLGVSSDERWLRDTLNVYQVRPPYKYDDDLVAHYAKQVAKLFDDQPDVANHLMGMVAK
ncbi:MAG: hypothetical protein DWG76_02300 [Chloroflexi bacterium]|nr:hypothetical protein [Chloroflexota bacterium]